MEPPSQTPPLSGVREGKLHGGFPVGWQLDGYGRDEVALMAASAVPHRGPADLLQNCDLPPPLKVFPPTPNKMSHGAAGSFLPPPSRPSLRKADHQGTDGVEIDRGGGGGGAQDHLLKALQLSQTRAREAEKVAAALGERNQKMASLLVEESLRLYAHRQWLTLLETENSWLRQEPATRREGPPAPRGYVVVAACLGIAGLGFLVGYRFLI